MHAGTQAGPDRTQLSTGPHSKHSLSTNTSSSPQSSGVAVVLFAGAVVVLFTATVWLFDALVVLFAFEFSPVVLFVELFVALFELFAAELGALFFGSGLAHPVTSVKTNSVVRRRKSTSISAT